MNDYCLELKHIKKSFVKGEEVLGGISLSVKQGEFITLLGSSGCGKTTTLRIIAGLESPDEGQVFLNGEDVTRIDPDKRDVNTVFQNYALFPHMNVAENIGYGLKLKRVPRAEIKKRVAAMLDLVQLPGFEKRKPSELSGGQRQRVAIARSLVNNPKVLLLDEPLGALDLQLRRSMQLELKRLQKKLGITFIYITHDQEEALNMSSRIAVMNHGRFEQIGTPDEIYNYPRTSYVATFVGNANILRGKVLEAGKDTIKVETCVGEVLVQTPDKRRYGNYRLLPGQEVTIAVRSENIRLDKECEIPLKAIVKEKNFAGGQLRLELALPDGTRIIASRYGLDYNVGLEQPIHFDFQASHAVLVDLMPQDDAQEKTAPGDSQKEAEHA